MIATPLAPALLIPAALLILWSLVMLIWMGTVRYSAFKAAGITFDKMPAGGRGQDLDKMLPPQSNWAAHNYMHLMEQPTLFYATVLILAMLGQGSALNLAMAWAYVLLRIVHSVWQARINIVAVRATLFLLSTLALAILAVNALLAAIRAA